MIQIYFSFVVMLASIFLCIFDRISCQFFVRLLFLCPCCLVCSAHFSSSMDFHICILWALSMLCYVKALCLLVSYWCAASLSLAYLRLILLRFWFFLFVVFIFFVGLGISFRFEKQKAMQQMWYVTIVVDFFFINWWWWWWWCWCMCCVVYLYTCRTRMQSIPFCERGNQPIFFLSSDLFFSILLHLSLSLAGLSIKTFFSLFSPLLFLLVFVHLFKKDSSCVSIAVFWGDGCFYISRGVFWFLNVPGIVCTVYD